jgi:hypothetical protein
MSVRSSLTRTATIAVAIAALVAPTASARLADTPPTVAKTAAADQHKQNRRSHDTRAAARATTPSDPTAARPESAGNPNISADATRAALAQERYYMSYGVTPAADAALAQERYYASYGKPTPLTHATRTVAADTGNGIARLPFVIAVVGALIVGLGAGSGLHLLHARRRHATRLAT